LLFTDFALFNCKLADWLVFYNTERPHHSLSQQSPLSFLLEHQPECQRYWTHTPATTQRRTPRGLRCAGRRSAASGKVLGENFFGAQKIVNPLCNPLSRKEKEDPSSPNH
jgi:hypothetical protein